MTSLNITPEHWTNTFMGMLNLALGLSPEEEVFAGGILYKLLFSLDIFYDNIPDNIPVSVYFEAKYNTYTKQLISSRDNSALKSTHSKGDEITKVSLDAWAQAMLSMLYSTYPNISPVDRIKLILTVRELLASLGIPDRPTKALPPEVIAAYRACDVLTY